MSGEEVAAPEEVIVGDLERTDEGFGGREAGADLELSGGTLGDVDEDVDGVLAFDSCVVTETFSKYPVRWIDASLFRTREPW